MLETLDGVCRSGHRRTVARIVISLDRSVQKASLGGIGVASLGGWDGSSCCLRWRFCFGSRLRGAGRSSCRGRPPGHRSSLDRKIIDVCPRSLQVLGAIEEKGLLNNTVVAFASDNGACPAEGGSNWPLRGTKFSNFEGGVRVPAFVWSAKLPEKLRGATYRGIFHASDWLPTFLSAIGRAELAPRGIDGVDQWVAMRSSAETTPVHARDEVLLHLNKWSMHLGGASLDFNFSSGALRVGEWKLMVNEHPIPAYIPSHNWTANCTCTNQEGAGTRFLYNVVDDPEETTNLVAVYPGVARRIEARLHHYWKKAPATNYVASDATAYYVWMAAGGFIVPWNGTSGNGWKNYSLIHGDDNSPFGNAINMSGNASGALSGGMMGLHPGGPTDADDDDDDDAAELADLADNAATAASADDATVAATDGSSATALGGPGGGAAQ